MTADDLKKKFIDFFVQRGHKEIPGSSLIPENDSSALFVSAGMHPLIPYLLGEPYPLGKRLCSVQKCLRTDDIEAVGDTFHHTFFEMLGNWSLGDYWKEEMIPWSFEFLTKELNIPTEKIAVTCFAGDKDAPKDEETALLWKKVGISPSRIFFLGKKDNWWGPIGESGPCGPDSEMFYDTGRKECSSQCRPGCSCGKYIEIWNDVFMEYNKTIEGKFISLKQKNIDTGMGMERTLSVLDSHFDDYRTELFWPIIKQIEEIFETSYSRDLERKSMRILADHIKAAVFIAAEGIEPSNKDRGYILRRLIRRAAVKARTFGKKLKSEDFEKLAKAVAETYGRFCFDESVRQQIPKVIKTEILRFSETLERGLREVGKISLVDGKIAFDLYQTFGFPLELTEELFAERGQKIKRDEFEREFKKHQELSRTASAGMFKGGLADHSEVAVKYHTVTHLLHQALRDILGNQVRQVGSNINAERLRFDFTYPEKLTEAEIKQIEEMVNKQIEADLPVTMEIMSLDEAKERGALAFFEQKYGNQVKVYTIGEYSKEVCAGPHVNSTGDIGKIRIIKEESCGAGKRRIYAVLAESAKYRIQN